MAKLTTVELINELQTEYDEMGVNLSKDKTRELLDATFNVITENVKVGNSVPINGVGIFNPKKIAARQGVLAFGDKAGESWKSKEKNTMSFKVSKCLEF